jgi:predicted ATPase
LGDLLLHSLRLRNFRAFRSQSFDFARINIFVGKNSSGKSSALSAINFLAQSLNQSELSVPIVFNGPFEQLGTFVDIVHGNHVLTPIEFDLTYGEDDIRHRVNFSIKYRPQRRETEISSFSYSHGVRVLYEYFLKRKEAYEVRIDGQTVEQMFPGTQKSRPVFNSIFPLDRNVTRYLPQLSGEEEIAGLGKDKIEFLRNADRRMRAGRSELRWLFSRFDSLSPFRDQPQRTYLFTGEAPSTIGKTGSNGIAMLANDSSRRGSVRSGILEDISEWLRVTNIAKGVELNALTQRHFEICLIDLDGKRHNICDVGFGCSQVLPVLIGALNAFRPRNRQGPQPIFVVQEPEIHLNPSAQAALGSFFVSLSKSSGQLFIETHSDHLILRVARHIAMGQLDHNDVAIFFCENNDGQKVATRIDLDSLAVFKPEWPGGFFPQRENETLGIARARMKKKSDSGVKQMDFFYPENAK